MAEGFQIKTWVIAGDVGGARAIIPALERLAKSSTQFSIADHGFLSKEAPVNWPRIPAPFFESSESLEKSLKQDEVGVLVFGTSVEDTIPLSVARLSKSAGIPVICVLDNWMGYRRRLEMDGLPMLLPDNYAVMDDLAFKEALADGIPSDILIITGQPALSSLAEDYEDWQRQDHSELLSTLGLSSNKKLIAFISEPAEADHGTGPESAQFRGYTEKTVLSGLCHQLQAYSDEIVIGLVPHPREDPEALIAIWEKRRGNLEGGLLQLRNGREAIFLADGVAGMASILLYEAWLINKPVVSFQPGLLRLDLTLMSKKPGCHYLIDPALWSEAVYNWIIELRLGKKQQPLNPELKLHLEAPARLAQLIKSYLTSRDVSAKS